MTNPAADPASTAPDAPRLGLLSCQGFAREVALVVQGEGWDDVDCRSFGAHCARPALTWDAVRAAAAPTKHLNVLCGQACARDLQWAPADLAAIQVLRQTQCFHWVAPAALVDDALAQHVYLLTPGWLAHWPDRLRDLGFDPPDTARDFFHEFAHELLLLDTLTDPDSSSHLQALSQALELPARRVVVGLDTLRLHLRAQVQAWHNGRERERQRELQKQHRAELADLRATLDILTLLTQASDEAAALATTELLFRQLFAPRLWFFLPHGADASTAQLPDTALLQWLGCLQQPYALTPSGLGFALRVERGGTFFGSILVEGLAFPQYRDRYLNLALATTGLCALVVEHARHRQRLQVSEKLAALGSLVAGVAHEINTPVGVAHLAGTTLESQLQTLQTRFEQRSLTQSDLRGFLADGRAQTGLIAHNLQRVARLVARFRSIAVEPASRAPASLPLRESLGEVLAALGARLRTAQATVHLDCEPDLYVPGDLDDWASIWTNLIVNTLDHGLRNRASGRIDISARTDGQRIAIEYRDDGSGLDEATRRRVFDPFFTTDMQRGMGLGMHLVYNLLTHKLAGHIASTASTTPGARFLIDVPCAPATPAPTA